MDMESIVWAERLRAGQERPMRQARTPDILVPAQSAMRAGHPRTAQALLLAEHLTAVSAAPAEMDEAAESGEAAPALADEAAREARVLAAEAMKAAMADKAQVVTTAMATTHR